MNLDNVVTNVNNIIESNYSCSILCKILNFYGNHTVLLDIILLLIITLIFRSKILKINKNTSLIIWFIFDIFFYIALYLSMMLFIVQCENIILFFISIILEYIFIYFLKYKQVIKKNYINYKDFIKKELMIIFFIITSYVLILFIDGEIFDYLYFWNVVVK